MTLLQVARDTDTNSACYLRIYCIGSSRIGWLVNQKGMAFLWRITVDLKLTEKIVLVTGSTAGIGFAIAQSLASEGGALAITRDIVPHYSPGATVKARRWKAMFRITG